MPGTLAVSTTTNLDKVDDVVIDIGGRFKYVLCKVYEPGDSITFKYIVRGTALAEFHSGIYDVLDGELEILGISSECVGGGKIEHNPAGKAIVVFGASQGYGQADHSVTVDLLRKKYPDYNDISWKDEY